MTLRRNIDGSGFARAVVQHETFPSGTLRTGTRVRYETEAASTAWMCYAGDMPRFEPFSGIRYMPPLRLDDVISPPYDVINASERSSLIEQSPFNSVLIDLPSLGEAGEPADPYQHAAELLRSWQDGGVLGRDPQESLYAYRMTFTDEVAGRRTTLGIIGALGVTPPDDGDVLPHENTLPKAKSDRLQLLRACRANLSPVWGLSLTGGLTKEIAAAASSLRPADQQAIDQDGVRHELWRIGDTEAIERICAAVQASPVVIADGHHRYETALAYAREVRSQVGTVTESHELVMALVVELTPEELHVHPVHRALSGLPEDLDPVTMFEQLFVLADSPRIAHALAVAEDSFDPGALLVNANAMGLVTSSGAWLLRQRALSSHTTANNDPSNSASVPGTSDDDLLAGLDSAVLDAAMSSLPHCDISYKYSWGQVRKAISSGAAQAAVLLRPATVAQIAAVAHSNRRMPPKTTYFHPKPRTGMVFRTLDDSA